MLPIRVLPLILIVVSVFAIDSQDFVEDVKKELEFQFQRADINSDEQLDSEEVVRWMDDLDQELKDETITATWKEIRGGDFFYVDKNAVMDYVCKEDEKCLERFQNRMSTINVEDDGRMTKGQLGDLLYPQYSEDKQIRLNPLTEYLQEADVDGDSKISLNEYLSTPPKGLQASIRGEYFHKHLDKDGDGKLCESEVWQWLSPENEAYATEVIVKADSNNDSLLSKDEIIANYLDFMPLVPRSYFEQQKQKLLLEKEEL